MKSFLLLVGVLLQSFCFLTASGQPNFDNDYSLGNSTYTDIPIVPFGGDAGFNSILVSNLTYCALVTRNSDVSSGQGPICYLEVNSIELVNRTHYWTKPCPATPQQLAPGSASWCQFEFTQDGNLLLKSGLTNVSVANGTVLWSSNTSGLGATSLALLDSDPASGPGNLVLYNANKEILWSAIGNSSASEEYHCSYENYPILAPAPAPTPSAGRKLLQH
ncbi:hypothetical protein M758_1G165800 [Ceratodon purpureus]|nr:hypothetical protein M758_1G165800 [Ceratodon purpureus]